MPLNGSGVAVISSSGQPVVATTLITAAAFNALTADLATMISTAVMKDGQQTITANIPFNTYKITGLGDGSALQDAATLKNVQNGTGIYVATVGGTADAIMLTPSPAITAYVAGQTFRFIASGANTTAVTVAVSGLVAKAVTKNGTTALIAGDIPSGTIVSLTYDGTRFILGTPGRDFATLTGIEVLTNKTLTSPVVNTGTVGADPTADLGIASKQYVDKTVASYTGTANLGSGVGFARLSGASFTLTLPVVANNTNRDVTIKHLGTSLTQVYTVKGNGSESIIAPDGTANTYLLYTNGEEVTLKCDGASWYVHHHTAITDWTDVGAMTITGTTSDPTKPTTPDLDKVYWRRSGNQVFLRYILQISSASGSAAGSGAYLFALPTNIAFDTTVLTPVASAYATSLMSEAVASAIPGMSVCVIDSAATDPFQLYAYDTTHFQAARTVTVAVIGSAAYALNNAEMGYYFELSARAANWRL